MKSNKRLIDILIVVLISSFIGMICGAGFIYTMSLKKDNHIKASNVKEIDEVYNMIVSKYYSAIDVDKVVEGAVSGMLSVLDTHTSYLDNNAANNFNKKMNGEYFGVGIEALTVEEGVLVISVVKGSPADDSNIQEGDIIKKVNNEYLSGKKATYFSELVSKNNKEIELLVERDGRELNINITPEKITVESVTTNKFVINGKNIGYIKISLFAFNTATQFESKLKLLEETGLDALVIDVRDNSGGYLSSASTILELFMNKGDTLYQTENKNSIIQRKDETKEHRDYPVAILVNKSSASASEVLAASFRDNKKSEIIGTTTYGKGTVQEMLSVSDDAMAKITTKKWLTPNGEWINDKGITPTINIGASDTYINNPTFDNDNQLEKAMQVLSMK